MHSSQWQQWKMERGITEEEEEDPITNAAPGRTAESPTKITATTTTAAAVAAAETINRSPALRQLLTSLKIQVIDRVGLFLDNNNDNDNADDDDDAAAAAAKKQSIVDAVAFEFPFVVGIDWDAARKGRAARRKRAAADEKYERKKAAATAAAAGRRSEKISEGSKVSQVDVDGWLLEGGDYGRNNDNAPLRAEQGEDGVAERLKKRRKTTAEGGDGCETAGCAEPRHDDREDNRIGKARENPRVLTPKAFIFKGDPPNGAALWTREAMITILDRLDEAGTLGAKREFITKVINKGKTEYANTSSIYKMHRKWKQTKVPPAGPGRPRKYFDDDDDDAAVVEEIITNEHGEKVKITKPKPPRRRRKPPKFSGEPPDGDEMWTREALVSRLDELDDYAKHNKNSSTKKKGQFSKKGFLSRVLKKGKTEYANVSSIYKMHRKWRNTGVLPQGMGRPRKRKAEDAELEDGAEAVVENTLVEGAGDNSVVERAGENSRMEHVGDTSHGNESHMEHVDYYSHGNKSHMEHAGGNSSMGHDGDDTTFNAQGEERWTFSGFH